MRAARSGASHFFYGPGVLQQGIVLPAAMVGFEGCRESRLGVGVDRQAWQADTPVADIVGSRRSASNACSGSSRVIRFRKRSAWWWW